MIKNKKLTYWLSTLILLSIISILILQGYWISHSYTKEHNEFKENVHKALSEFDLNLSIKNRQIILLDDHIEYEYEYYSPDSTYNFYGSYRIEKEQTKDVTFDNQLFAVRKEQFRQINQFFKKDSLAFPNLLEEVELTITQQCVKCRDYKVFNLDSMLTVSLKKFGVSLPFQFGVYNKNKKKWDYLSDKQIDTLTLSQTTYQKPFQASEKKDKSFHLLLQKEDRFILQKIQTVIALSIALLLLISASFFYLLRFALQQKKLSEMRTSFINNMTHEFKTPVANILLGVDNIENAHIINKPAAIQNFTKIIRKESIRINEMVNTILEHAQLDRGHWRLNLEHVDMHQLIKQLLDIWVLPVQERGGKITVDLAATKMTLFADEALLYQAISNILDNANKYSLDTPDITIQTYNTIHSLHIKITDKGIGFSALEKKHIFEKFYRIPTKNLHDVKGFGLGLNYAENIIHFFKGKINVESEKGKGSSFEIVLPIS
ncbi:HAMP domain-containing histidine kinase [Aquimarina sp. TRL1]|uniref:sensor histidine kinase n=1 Tax=Aquimarina sp. (strain TRL1) TaxID=2736252 RepID=UPI00158855C5|nr:HAMP domain-containing sensor histidine kinase [Aquimarina sp. TRL1]QKX03639.1 HAMP domain-containing histidine kinase [Aquimarina sp. TRL1]